MQPRMVNDNFSWCDRVGQPNMCNVLHQVNGQNVYVCVEMRVKGFPVPTQKGVGVSWSC